MSETLEIAKAYLFNVNLFLLLVAVCFIVCVMVDLGGYVIILLKTKDRKIKLYGSKAHIGREDLTIDDEILDVNGHCLAESTRGQAIAHIQQCIKSRIICLRCKQRHQLDLNSDNIQDAFLIAVEPKARERLEKLSAYYNLHAVDMLKLCDQLNRSSSFTGYALNGFADDSRFSTNGLAKDHFRTYSLRATRRRTFEPLTLPVSNPPKSEALKSDKPSTVTNAVKNDEPKKKPTEPKVKPSQPKSPELKPKLSEPKLKCSEPPLKGPEPKVKIPEPNLRSTEGEVIFRRTLTVDEKGPDTPTIRRVSLCVPENEQKPEVRRASSPFTNGGTELLIGPPEEYRSKGDTGSKESLNRDNRKGDFVKVVPKEFEDEKSIISDEQYDRMMMVMAAMDGPHRELPVDVDAPHRELPVDVPDSFVGRNKTPPRYPPPKPVQAQLTNGSAPRTASLTRENHTTGPPPVPLTPPRIIPTTINNNNISLPSKEPNEEQLNKIRNYQDILRKRKEEEDRIAQEAEFLNRSLRGSKKLQALESIPSGIVNDAYHDDESSIQHAELEPVFHEEIHKIFNYGELFASLQRLKAQLKKAGINIKPLDVVQILLQRSSFHRILSIHNKVQQAWSLTEYKKPITNDAKSLITECIKDLQGCSLPEATKLTEFLDKNEVEGLLHAHDTIVNNYFPGNYSALIVENEKSLYSHSTDPNIRIIRIEKTNEPLGATVKNQGDAVLIGRVQKGGAAEKTGLLHKDDEILEVNGLELRGKSINEVCDILSTMTGALTFYVRCPHTDDTTINCNKEVLIYVKALFDFDAEEDIYVPCKELGISFQKGDILIVKSQEDDANWWQAYRYGEHDHSLAGLIPSKSFWIQREALKQRIAGEKIEKEKTRKAATFLCAGKNLKKKRKKSPFQSYQDGGYPLYSSSSTDEYDMEEVPTYEEVVCYYPSMNHKRPIVLIGPPNIGRHELRQRLMEDSERFAAAVPHTSRARKEGEVDGQDYHFITRSQFEGDILARKFVEHGEYEKAYYGTSLDAIRAVVSSGKICVLNLHAQSLKILRSSDLMPYVVFVAPPSLEKLRQKKLKSGEPVKEDELKDIIEKAREMEDKYGHYFDMIIINNDTERAYHELLHEVNKVEREPQWIPASWVRNGHVRFMNNHNKNNNSYYGRGN